MKFCKDCEGTACCDFCRYVIEEKVEFNGKIIDLAPIGCMLHSDKEHQELAKSCSYCEDFYCIHADKKENK